MNARLKVIQAARHLFAKYQQFNQIDQGGRQQLAGLAGVVDDVDYGFFGSMIGAGKFWTAINGNDENLSAALDMIPPAGSITRDTYLQFIDQYKLAFPEGRDGIGTATRLLAMKRPDVFVCLDSKNKTLLCRDFGISRTVDYEKYWDSIVARIMESVWWYSPPPSSAVEREVWGARAAFLDSIFYEADVQVADAIPKKWLGTTVPVEHVEEDNIVDGVPFGNQVEEWEQFKTAMHAGDQIFGFSSPADSWEHLAGRAGYALVRHGKVIRSIVTLMN